ncbi:peptidase inhibitor 16-like [Littorina saxatilis]|uniref:SCP domain-containing protein n=1 Tax=Littorina saxatilis TaxID=31220 RepID=A0AAN9B8X9_9CAEN
MLVRHELEEMNCERQWLVLLVLTSFVVTSSADVRIAALNGHNYYRNLEATQENVANMNALVWSNELANRAYQWAARCRWGHTSTRDMGENLYYSYPRNMADDVYVYRALKSWMDEKRLNWDKSFSCCSKSYSCCHYTQVVSSKSQSVGCAVVPCSKLYDETGFRAIATNAAYVACFYSPMGNMVYNGDPRPYRYGPPCTQCPRGCSRGENLCSTL